MASVVMVTWPPSATSATPRDGRGWEPQLSDPRAPQRLGELLAAALTQRRDGLRNVANFRILIRDRHAVGSAQDEAAAVFGLDRHRLGHRVLDVDRHTFGAG